MNDRDGTWTRPTQPIDSAHNRTGQAYFQLGPIILSERKIPPANSAVSEASPTKALANSIKSLATAASPTKCLAKENESR
jgi:hypothetical protein